MLASPVPTTFGELLSSVWTQGPAHSNNPGSSQPNVFTFDNSTGAFVPVSDMNHSMAAGQGVAVYLFARDQHNDDSSLNWPKVLDPGSGSEPTENLTLTGLNPATEGFSLIGNPFAATLQFSSLNRTNILNQVWVYDYSFTSGFEGEDEAVDGSAGGGWRTWNGSVGSLQGGLISANQSFFIRKAAGSPGLTIPRSAKVSGSATLFNELPPTPQLQLAARLNGSLISDLWVGFSEDGTIGHNPELDLEMLYPLDFHPFLSLFTGTSDASVALDIKNLPADLADEVSLPVFIEGWQPGQDGTYEPLGGQAELIWPVMENLPEHWNITLSDTQTGEIINLREAQTYSFTLDAEKSADRSLQYVFGIHRASLKSDMQARLILTIDPESPTRIPGANERPHSLSLYQNYPNPFNPTTTIDFELPESADVRLEVFNITGQRVAVLLSENRSAGTHSVSFDASSLSSGVYLYRLMAGAQTLTRMMTLVK